jgi:hypothetical protein
MIKQYVLWAIGQLSILLESWLFSLVDWKWLVVDIGVYPIQEKSQLVQRKLYQ